MESNDFVIRIKKSTISNLLDDNGYALNLTDEQWNKVLNKLYDSTTLDFIMEDLYSLAEDYAHEIQDGM